MIAMPRAAAAALAVVALVALTACGGSPAGPANSPSTASPPQPGTSALPPRPTELRLDGVDPCSLLSSDQRRELGVNGGVFARDTNSTVLSGDSCLWSNLPNSPDNAYLGRLVLRTGAGYALGREPLRMVDGFPATTTGSVGSDPTYYCLMLVDVAPGQALGASYDNGRKDYPGMNHRLACDKAQELASMMLSTLRAMKQR
jgi:hypothetical protein